MRSLIKPPVLIPLTMKFYKYEKKKINFKVYSYSIKFLLACEKTPIYLLTLSKLFSQNTKNLILGYEDYFFESYFFSLLFMTSTNSTWSNQTIFKHLVQNTLDYAKFFWWRDLSLNRTKYLIFSEVLTYESNIWFTKLKDYIFHFSSFIYQWNFTLLKTLSDFFFFNTFFFLLFLGLFKVQKKNLKPSRRVALYFGLDFITAIFIGKYDQLFSSYNRFLTLQTGLLKQTKYFINWNYLFVSSTQFIKSKKIFFLNFFFRNKYFWISNKHDNSIRKISRAKLVDGTYIWDWNTTILPFFINKIFHIYNGCKFIWVRILPGMVGFKLGQFSFTRKVHAWNVNLWSYFRNLFAN
jgi:small subunit ribosomal protein S19